MSDLVGLHNPIRKYPSFLVPVFSEHKGTNTLYVQVINHNDIVEEFDPTNVERHQLIDAGQVFVVNVGDHALWSFAFGEQDLVVDTRAGLSHWLRPRLDEPALRRQPFLYLEAAEFAGAEARRLNALREVFELIARSSERQAEAWRDLDVLLPEARAGIRAIIALAGRLEELETALRKMTMEVSSGKPTIKASETVFELVSQSPARRRRDALARANAAASAFGLRKVRIRPIEGPLKGKGKMARAQPSGLRLSEAQASLVKGMLLRGDRQHDIAAWFGVNSGRIADVKKGESHPNAPPAPPDELPPLGSPGPVAFRAMRALIETSRALEGIRGAQRAKQIVDAELGPDAQRTKRLVDAALGENNEGE
jgi:hypothetical protein